MNIILLYHDIIDRDQGTQLPLNLSSLTSVLFIISPFQRALQNVHRSYTAPVLKGSCLFKIYLIVILYRSSIACTSRRIVSCTGTRSPCSCAARTTAPQMKSASVFLPFLMSAYMLV